MKKMLPFVRKYPLSLCCIVLIWVLSLVPFFPETPFDDVAFIDKWTHLVMYGGTALVFWWEDALHSSVTRRPSAAALLRFSLFTFIFLTAMGGLLELLQAYCTTTRSGEWLDFWADGAGALSGNAAGLLASILWFKARKKSRHSSPV